MKNKLLLIALGSIAPCLAHASLYTEARVARLQIEGTPNVGDVGVVLQKDEPSFVPSIALGWEFTPRIRAEIRYSDIGDIDIEKRAPSAAIFPGNQVSAQVLTRYRYEQKTDLISLAVPLEALSREKLSVTVTPVINVEKTDIHLDRIYEAYESVIANAPPLYQRKETEVRAAAEVAVSYKLADRTVASVAYTYAPLKTFDAHLISAGLRFRF